MADSIFLDNQSTTLTDPRVRQAMLPFVAAGAVAIRIKEGGRDMPRARNARNPRCLTLAIVRIGSLIRAQRRSTR